MGDLGLRDPEGTHKTWWAFGFVAVFMSVLGVAWYYWATHF